MKFYWQPFMIIVLVGALTACNKTSSTASADSIPNPNAANPNAAPLPQPAAPETAPAPAPAPVPATVIPAGTTLRVALIDPVSSDKNQAGDRFSASLAEAVVIDGKTVLRKGTRLHGRVVEAKESGRVKGRASIELQLTEMTLGDGKPVNIVTKPYSAVAPATKKRDAEIIGGGAGIGAAIGAIAGGGKGALIGAGIGGGAGTGTVLATKGKEIRYPAETRLQFTLASPLEI